MHRIILICVTCLIVAVTAAAQEQANYQSAEELQREVTLLLLDKNIDDVANRLDSESGSAPALLRRLVIYGRAGQTPRVRSTLKQLSSLGSWRCEVGYDLKWLIRSADTSLDGLR